MMFTGKNKEDFEKWLFVHLIGENYSSDEFEHFTFSMQQGVYLEYLDSVGYYCDAEKDMMYEDGIIFTYYINASYQTSEHFRTRQEALKEAFKKADELINNK